MPLFLEGRSSAVAGRRLTITRDKSFSIRTRTTNHDGEVQVGFIDGCYRLDNRSHMRCRINGVEQKQAALSDGDDLEIGKDRFVVAIQTDSGVSRVVPADDQDELDTKSLSPVTPPAIPVPASTMAAPMICAVCDAQIVPGQRDGATWSKDGRHLCARCIAKGVKPEHLPNPTPLGVMPDAITPIGGLPVLRDDARESSAIRPPELSGAKALSSDSDLLEPARQSTTETPPDGSTSVSSESDRQRQSRRISASRLTAVEPAQRQGLLSRVGKVFGRRDERQLRLEALEADRAALLAEAGRHALGAGGSLGLPEKIVAALFAGGTVFVGPADLAQADLERWRAQRQRMVLLDAEIAALRRALGMGSDPQMHQQSSPTLRPDQKAMQDRAFATLDGLSTDELSRPDPQPAAGEATVKNSGRMRTTPGRRRR
jgi:hypothetical protein